MNTLGAQFQINVTSTLAYIAYSLFQIRPLPYMLHPHMNTFKEKRERMEGEREGEMKEISKE